MDFYVPSAFIEVNFSVNNSINIVLFMLKFITIEEQTEWQERRKENSRIYK